MSDNGTVNYQRPIIAPAPPPPPPPPQRQAGGILAQRASQGVQAEPQPQSQTHQQTQTTHQQPQTRLQSQGASDLRGANAAALAPAAAMGVRGELNAPLNPDNAFRHYQDFQAKDFSGPDDIRLRQMHNVASKENIDTVRRINGALKDAGIQDAQVYGRAKTPSSMFGKLMETEGSRIGDIKDMSGARVDLKMNKPGFEQVYDARKAVQESMGDAYHAGKDYIAKPNKWGYTGRIHDGIAGKNVPNTELQFGSRDLSKFIDGKVTNASGQSRSVHDLTGYKGELYGAKVPENLQNQYPEIMKDIAENDRAGRTLQQNPELQAKVDGFKKNVTETLPDKFKAPPEPELPRSTKLKNMAGKGMGVLGMVGGGFQANHGMNELQEGKIVEGTADVAGGTANMMAGGALVAGRVALGTTIGGVAATIDGGKDIITGIRDGNVEKTAVGGVKTGAGVAMMAGVATANPVLIAGGAITYGGAVVYENRKAIGDAAVAGAHYVGDKASQAAGYLGNKASQAASAVGDAGRTVAGWLGW